MTENIKSTCYVVVSYPKKANPMMINSKRFYIHPKMSTNLEEMRKYFEYTKTRKRFENDFIHLVSYDKAIAMRTKWREKYEPLEQPAITLEELDRRINNLYASNAYRI